MRMISYYASLFQDNVATTGIAMRDETGHVFFRTEHTGLWQELTDADAPNLHLHGKCDLVLAAALAQPDLVISTSRTLQAA